MRRSLYSTSSMSPAYDAAECEYDRIPIKRDISHTSITSSDPFRSRREYCFGPWLAFLASVFLLEGLKSLSFSSSSIICSAGMLVSNPTLISWTFLFVCLGLAITLVSA